MDEWWTYRLSDFLLFSPNSFFRQFELYNEAIWPGQLAAIALGGLVFKLFYRDGAGKDRLSRAILSVCWLWVAWGYFATRHAAINWAATYLAAAFAIQALLLLAANLADRESGTGGPRCRPREVASGFLLFAVFLYPLTGILAGRPWSQAEIFGLAPDPTVVATLGVLLAAPRLRGLQLVIPLTWCAVSGAARWTMEAPDFWIMPAAGLLAIGFAVHDAVGARRGRTLA